MVSDFFRICLVYGWAGVCLGFAWLFAIGLNSVSGFFLLCIESSVC